MSEKKATRAAQYPLVAEFTFDIAAGDAMKDVNGVSKSFAVGGVFDVINLPGNAVVIGGDLTVETASDDSGTATIAVGDSGSATRYLAATNLKAAARTALNLTGYRGAGENIRLTIANQNGNATVGKATVRVMYTIQGRANEVQPG
jgi:hypothetical protein